MISKLIGLLIVVTDLTLVYRFETSPSVSNAGFSVFHWPAMVLTGIGPIGLVLLCSEWKDFRRAFRVALGRSTSSVRKAHAHDASLCQQLGRKYYQVGFRAFEGGAAPARSTVMKRVLNKLALHAPVADIRETLEFDRDHALAQAERSIEVLGTGVKLTPSIGMLGTILGMVQLLSQLKDPSNIGAPMAMALLTTFFGLFFSLIAWTPLQNRAQAMLDEEAKFYAQILGWLELLERRKPVDLYSDSLFNDAKGVSAGLPS